LKRPLSGDAGGSGNDHYGKWFKLLQHSEPDQLFPRTLQTFDGQIASPKSRRSLSELENAGMLRNPEHQLERQKILAAAMDTLGQCLSLSPIP
jgi:hypothetical protein